MRSVISISQLLTLLFALATCTAQSVAQVTTIESENGDSPTIYKMTVSPAAEQRPALKYHFLTPPVDQIKGNAATLYYKGMVFEGPDLFLPGVERGDKMYDYLEMPLEKLLKVPQDELNDKMLGIHDKTAWQPIREARSCDHCDWEDLVREDGVGTLLPQAQKMRAVGICIALRARAEIAANEYSDAIEHLADGYSLAHNMATGPTLIHVLIGIAIQGVMHSQARALIAADNSPNLYWALTDLSERQIDTYKAMSFESRMWDFSVHSLSELDRRVLTPQEAADLAHEVWQLSTTYTKSPRSFLDDGAILLWTLQLYSEGRVYLLDHGYTAEKLDAMPALQVALLYRWKQFEEVRDDMFKVAMLPKNEFLTQIKAADARLRQDEKDGRGMPFTRFLPAIQAAQYATIRSHRQTAELRVVEALRMYAAEHGHWPDSLTDIKNVPIPNDPYSDQPFGYAVRDGVAVVKSVVFNAPFAGYQYELTLRQKSDAK